MTTPVQKTSGGFVRWLLVLHVLQKELLSSWRDRRTLVSTVLLPLVMIPLFLIGMPLLFATAFGGESERKQNVGVIGMERAPKELIKILETSSKFSKGVNLIAVTNGVLAVQKNEVEAAIEIPAKMPTEAGGAPVEVKIIAKQSSQKASVVVGKLETAIETLNRQLVSAKLKKVGLPSQTLTPLKTVSVSADTAAEKASGLFAFLIPLFILQWIAVGGQATAIDSTAGEKERGTLEALLVTPVSRLEVVMGKLMAVASFSILSTVVSMLSLLLTGFLAKFIFAALGADKTTDKSGADLTSVFGGNLAIGLDGFLLLLLVGISLALFISGLLLSISVFARSFKEAQTYIAPVTIIISLGAVFLQFGDFIGRGIGLYSIPVIGSAIVILDTVKGVVGWGNGLVVIAINLLCAAIMLALALASFRREEVLFRN